MAAPTVTIERKKAHRVEMTAVFDAATVAAAEKAAILRLGAEVKLEGFRPGKAPADMLKAQLNPQRLFEETVHDLLQERLAGLLEEHAIRPVIPPRVEAVSRTPVTLKIVFVEKPEATVKAGKIKVEKKEMQVEQKDIDGVVASTLEQFAVKTPVDRAAKEGDEVVMTFRGSDKDGNDVAGASAEGYEIVLGSKQLVPGFEDALVGLAKGEAKTFTVTMPAKYHAKELANQPMTFAVTLTEVREVQRPALTDAFVKEKLSFDSVDAWKKHIEGNIRAQDERFLAMQREQELMQQIIKHTSVDLAEELVAEETKALIEEFAERLAQRGQTLSDWLKQTGKKPEDAEKEFGTQAAERLTLRLGLAALIEEKKVELTQEETDALTKDTLGGRTVASGEATDLLHNAMWRKKVEKLIAMFLM